eukprot:s2157_g5.t1
MPDAPFQHGMYQEDLCAGQCNQHWFNKNWSSLISGGAGTFGFFDPERSLNSGQVLREALLTGHETPSSMSLSSYIQDVAGLLEAVAAFQTVGVSTTTVTASPTQTVTTSSSAPERLARKKFQVLLLCMVVAIDLMSSTSSTRSRCGTGLATDPNDFSSLSAMTSGGWSCVNCYGSYMKYYWSASNGDCATTPADTFCGYSQDSGYLFELRMGLIGSGVLHLDFSALKADKYRETKASHEPHELVEFLGHFLDLLLPATATPFLPQLVVL